jgi:lysophospholipase L1-like esterase
LKPILRLAAWLAGLALAVHPAGADAATKKRPAALKAAVRPSNAAVEGRGALEPFLRSLEAGNSVTRVIHFGDSHVAADYWSGELRRLLQGRYGDAGPGFVMPGNPWIGFRNAQARSFSTGGWETIGLGREGGDGLQGRSGTALSPTGGDGAAGVEGTFSGYRVELLTLSSGACLSVTVDGVTQFAGLLDPPEAGETADEACCRLVHAAVTGTPYHWVGLDSAVPIPGGPHRLEIRDACGGLTRILGVDLLSGRPGVVVDTLGLNGAELGALAKWQPDLRRTLLRSADPALVIVSYGTNDMGRGDFDYADYRARALEILRSLREDLPGASILVTGPIDRAAGKKKGGATIARNAPLVTKALREAAAAAGCAFWDAKAAMGGDGSIRKWAKGGLAQRDLVHLTGTGYGKLAGMLFDVLTKAPAEGNAGK